MTGAVRVLDLFSGIGGFALAFRRAGADHLAFCEQDKACHRVLRRHFPGVPIINDVKEITKQKYPFQPDIICGGFPCQDVSVAGRRKGLAGERSGLWFEFIRIIAEYRPGCVVIENVPGLLSSNGGRDFAAILRGLVECGYGVAWRVLDSQYFGVPQRRNRVFIVASLDAGCAAEILFEREGGGWHPAPSREAGERVAGTITGGSGNRGWDNSADAANRMIETSLIGYGDGIDLARCVTTGEAKRQDYETCTMVTHSLRAAGADASEDGTGRGTPLVVAPDTAATLNSGGNAGGFRTEPGEHLIAFQINASDEVRTSDVGYTLNTNGNATGRNSPTIAGGFGVRRLMPVECERLQAFPDEWTRYGDDGGEISDSARYRMLGNAVTVSVAEWIAKRIIP